MDSYHAISNLCSLDKLFERVVLDKMTSRNPNLEGSHQHVFRANHNTTTAMLTLQNIICEAMEKNKCCLVYSVDLSTAFDLLRP